MSLLLDLLGIGPLTLRQQWVPERGGNLSLHLKSIGDIPLPKHFDTDDLGFSVKVKLDDEIKRELLLLEDYDNYGDSDDEANQEFLEAQKIPPKEIMKILNYQREQKDKVRMALTSLSNGNKWRFTFKVSEGRSDLKVDNTFNFSFECENDEYDDGSVWISALKVETQCPFFSSASVLINETQMGTEGDIRGELLKEADLKQIRQKLNFGDSITIWILGGGKGDTRVCDFMLKVPSAEASTGSVFAGKGKIVGKILDFLPTKVVKRFRDVSRMWNAQALKLLPDRVTVTLQLLGSIPLGLINIVQSQPTASRFPDWKLMFLTGFAHDGRTDRMEDLPESWKTFFEQHYYCTQGMKSLHLTGEVTSDLTLEMIQVALSGIQGSLVTLHLDMDILCNLTSPLKPHLVMEGVSLGLLKSVSLSSCRKEGKYDHRRLPLPQAAPVQTFLQLHLPALRMQELSVKNYQVQGTPTTTFAVLVMEQIARMQGTGRMSLPYLTSIVIEDLSKDGLGNAFLHPLASLRRGTLKSLTLRGICPFLNPLRPSLQQQFETLEELTLHFNVTATSGTKDIVINFPDVMWRLKSLSVSFFLSRGWVGRFLEKPITIRFDAGEEAGWGLPKIDYGMRFPSLSNLTISPAREPLEEEYGHFEGEQPSWRTFLPILTPFIKPASKIAERVQILNIPFVIGGKYHPILDNLETVFPNATFSSELGKAREGPMWTTEDGVHEDASWRFMELCCEQDRLLWEGK